VFGPFSFQVVSNFQILVQLLKFRHGRYVQQLPLTILAVQFKLHVLNSWFLSRSVYNPFAIYATCSVCVSFKKKKGKAVGNDLNLLVPMK